MKKILIRGGQMMLFSGLLLALAGCFGVVGDGYGYGPGYWGPGYDYGPDVTIFGGWGHDHYDHGYDHDFARRGAQSRAAIGGHFGGHAGGGTRR